MNPHESRALLDIVVQRLYGISLTIEAMAQMSAAPLRPTFERSAAVIDETIDMVRMLMPTVDGEESVAVAQAELLRRYVHGTSEGDRRSTILSPSGSWPIRQ